LPPSQQKYTHLITKPNIIERTSTLENNLEKTTNLDHKSGQAEILIQIHAAVKIASTNGSSSSHVHIKQ
jgi:hypothetical protein